MPSFTTKSFLAALVGAVSVAAHGHVESISVGGTKYEGLNPGSAPYDNPPKELVAWFATNTDNGFVEPSAFGDADIICHKGSKNAVKSAKVKAGEKITIKWDTWPESHKGPVIDYLAACGASGCTKVDKTDLKFFKIAEAGMTSGGKFASDDLIAAGNTWEVTIPTSLKAGSYVLRHEIIALHSAGQENGAQNYPKCFNLEVTGSGTETPEGITADKLYTPTDPGIKVNVYGDNSNYEMPGPALFSGASSGSGSSSSGNSTAPAPASSAPAATSAAPAATSAAAQVAAASSSPIASSAAPAATGSAGALPETFTLETFISWLEKSAGSSSTKSRRSRVFRA